MDGHFDASALTPDGLWFVTSFSGSGEPSRMDPLPL